MTNEKEPVYVRYVSLTDKCRRALALLNDSENDFKDEAQPSEVNPE